MAEDRGEHTIRREHWALLPLQALEEVQAGYRLGHSPRNWKNHASKTLQSGALLSLHDSRVKGESARSQVEVTGASIPSSISSLCGTGVRSWPKASVFLWWSNKVCGHWQQTYLPVRLFLPGYMLQETGRWEGPCLTNLEERPRPAYLNSRHQGTGSSGKD